VYFFLTGNLPLSLLLYLIGLAHQSYYYLRMDEVVTRFLEKAPEQQEN
jgi:hypothetical protein